MFIRRNPEQFEVKGVVGKVKNSQRGRATWVELFPFPEVNAKYGQGASNRYFPVLCRAISHSGIEVH